MQSADQALLYRIVLKNWWFKILYVLTFFLKNITLSEQFKNTIDRSVGRLSTGTSMKSGSAIFVLETINSNIIAVYCNRILQ